MSAPAFGSVEVRGISKFYGRKRALTRVWLELSGGQVTVLLGPNGSGKSTLLGVLSTLLAPSEGDVRYGTVTHRVASRTLRGAIGLVAHEPHLYPDLTGRENLKCFATLCGVADPAASSAAAIERADLVEAGDDPVGTYSRGMRQRLALERALLHNPQLVLLDEPFTGLDVRSTRVLVERLAALPSERRIIVVTTHDFAAAASVGTDVAVLVRGRLAWAGPCGSGTSEAQLRDLYHAHAQA